MMATREAQAQLALLPERVGVLETKVENIDDKLIDLKGDVKDMHDCLDQTRDRVLAQLDKMTDEYRSNAANYYVHADKLNEQQSEQHKQLAEKLASSHEELHGKIKDLERVKSKYTMYAMIGLAFAAGSGWLNTMNLPHLIKFFGL